VLVPCFLLFLCFREIHRKYSQNWTKQVPEVLFYPEASRDPKERRRGATRAPHVGLARPGPGPCYSCDDDARKELWRLVDVGAVSPCAW
jgi:hypothetical protein